MTKPSTMPLKRKRATSDSDDEVEDEIEIKDEGSPEDVPALQRMFKTGDWSDLTVEANNGALFKVHKTVVCPASPFFHAACTAGFLETHTNSVKLPESEKVVDGMMRHFYETPAPWVRADWYASASAASIYYDSVVGLIELRIAADKYGIATLGASIHTAFSAALQRAVRVGRHTTVVKIGRRLFDEQADFLEQMRGEAVKATAEIMPHVLRRQALFDDLYQHAEYLRRTLLHK